MATTKKRPTIAAKPVSRAKAVPRPKAQAKGSLRRVRSEFASLKEWGDWVNANCAAAREDDTPVLMGQTGGSRKRATHDQLMALIEEQRARYAGAGAGASSSA